MRSREAKWFHIHPCERNLIIRRTFFPPLRKKGESSGREAWGGTGPHGHTV